jgi:hypothetical protein
MDLEKPLNKYLEARRVASELKKTYPREAVHTVADASPMAIAQRLTPSDTPDFENVVIVLARIIAIWAGRN